MTRSIDPPVRPGGIDVVVPTVGRPSLVRLLDVLASEEVAAPLSITLVDDRRRPSERLVVPAALGRRAPVRTLRTGGRGPAFARNAGWVSGRAPWVVFLDDDVAPEAGWARALEDDLAAAPPRVAAVQGRIEVPHGTPPTDRERDVAGLAAARWATADLAVRRAALDDVGGFDPRFRRAYREDADLALRLRRRGWSLVRGQRRVVHPVAPAPWWISVARQRGNADDARLLVHHGHRWRSAADAPPGRRPVHALAVAAGLVGVAAGDRRAGRWGRRTWAVLTVEFALRRAAAGPRSARELSAMAATSVLIPPAAILAWSIGLVGAIAERRDAGLVDAILFDKDGTLSVDRPPNGDAAAVEPVSTARDALAVARAAGLATGVVTNQPSLATGALTSERLASVRHRLEELVGPFDAWHWCPHRPADGCDCRKPAPGLVEAAARSLGVRSERTAVVGDVGSDVDAAHAAGAIGVLVPNERTLDAEVLSAPLVMPDLLAAVRLLALRPTVGAAR